jgi:hypothetical protein
MNDQALLFLSTVLIGLGATLTFDLWMLFLKHAFKITPSDICLVGCWLLYMSEGTFKHSNIGSAPQKSAECTIGWIVHHMVGIAFAIVFFCIRRQQLVSAANAESCNRLRDCHRRSTIPDYATSIWPWHCCIEDIEAHAGRTS